MFYFTWRSCSCFSLVVPSITAYDDGAFVAAKPTNVLCKLENALPVMSITAGIYIMVVLSIERLRCVLPPPGQEIPSPISRSIGNVSDCLLSLLYNFFHFIYHFICPHSIPHITRFYPRDAMLARSLRQQRVCLSVCPSVCHTPVLCLAERKQDREMYTVW